MAITTAGRGGTARVLSLVLLVGEGGVLIARTDCVLVVAEVDQRQHQSGNIALSISIVDRGPKPVNAAPSACYLYIKTSVLRRARSLLVSHG